MRYRFGRENCPECGERYERRLLERGCSPYCRELIAIEDEAQGRAEERTHP